MASDWDGRPESLGRALNEVLVNNIEMYQLMKKLRRRGLHHKLLRALSVGGDLLAARSVWSAVQLPAPRTRWQRMWHRIRRDDSWQRDYALAERNLRTFNEAAERGILY